MKRLKFLRSKNTQSHLSTAFPAEGLIERSALLKDGNFIQFLSSMKEKTKVGEELQQITEQVLFLFSLFGSILVHNYHSIQLLQRTVFFLLQ